MAYKYPIPVDTYDTDGPQLLSGGGETAFNRILVLGSVSITNQSMRFVCFTARRTETITQCRTYVGATAQAGATLARIGVWTVDASDNFTALVASTTNDTALWTTPNAAAGKAFTASFTKVRGTRYAVGMLVDGTSTAPVLGCLSTGLSVVNSAVPRLNGFYGSQSNLPSTASVGSFTASTAIPYVELLP